jgi:hypothetical protein
VSDASRQLAGILLLAVPTIEFGGWSLLRMIARRIPGYLDNPVRQNLFRAGHAHASVLVLLAWSASSTWIRPTCPPGPGPWSAPAWPWPRS